MGNSIFDTLATQDTQKMQHDQAVSAPAATPAAQPNIFDTLAKNEGNLQAHDQPQGPTMSAAPKSSDLNLEDMSSDPFTKAGLRVATPFARKLMDAADKLHEVENFTQEGREAHPIQAHLGDIANKIEGFLFGGSGHGENIGTGKYGMVNNPALAAVSAAPGVAEGAGAVESGVKGMMSGSKAVQAGEEAPGLVKQVIQGEKVAQEPAKAAMAESAGAKNAGNGIRSLLDEPIQKAAKAERAAYDTIKEKAETDLKSLHDYKLKLEDALDDPTNIGNQPQLEKELRITDQAIKVHTDLATSKGLPPNAIKEAEAMTQKRYALEEIKKRLFNNESVVTGNASVRGSEETMSMKNAIRQVENLDKPSKYAREGSPSRLQQGFPNGGAQKLKQALYDAQNAGETALTKQKWAKIVGGILGVGGAEETIRHLAH